MNMNLASRRAHGYTLVDALRAHGTESRPDALAYRFLREDGEIASTVTFAELDRRARAIAVALAEKVTPGARALLVFTPGAPYIEAFWGCLYAGVVAVPAYPPEPHRLARSLGRLQDIIRDGDIGVVLTSRALLDRVEGILADAPQLAALEWMATDGAPDALASRWRAPDIGLETLAMLQYTSGSTARPKGVMLTHGNLGHNVDYIQEALQLTPQTRVLSWLPPYHDMGLIGCMLTPVVVGCSSTIFSPPVFLKNPLSWLQAITRFGITLSPAPNFAYELCVRKVSEADKRGLDLSTWTVALNGAEPVRADTVRRFTEAFASCGFAPGSLLPAYGLAETALMAAAPPVGRPPVIRAFDQAALEAGRVVPATGAAAFELVSCGRGPRDGHIWIMDPATGAPTDGVGEIWLACDAVARGYWMQPEHPAFAARHDGRRALRTGDLGFVHEGELYVTGRLKELIIVRGRNHTPDEIELSVERAQQATRPGCTVAFEADGGEGVSVVVELGRALAARRAAGEDIGPALEQATDRIRAEIARVHGLSLQTLAFIEPGAMPKTTSGKRQRRRCAADLRAGRLPLVHTVRMQQPTTGAVESALGIGPVTPAMRQRTLAELGVDSVRLAELSQSLQETHGLTLDAAALLETTLGDVLARVESTVKPLSTSAVMPAPPRDPIEWRLDTAHPALFARVTEAHPDLEALLAGMLRGVPVPPTNSTFDDGRAFRPEGHFRAWYHRLDSGEAVVAIKGSEVGCDDQLGFLQLLQQRPFERFEVHSVTNTLEYFLIQERKVPGALTLPEALSEADKAARLQLAFAERFDALGDFPVPLLVYRWPEAEVQRFRRRLRPLLDGFPASIFETELERGLACYVYYFPKPVAERVSHYANRLANEAQRTGQAGLRNTRLIHTTLRADFGDPGAVVESWIDAVARMLTIGWFPCDTRHWKNGQCIEPQNVLVNGALADMDSVTPFSALFGDKPFYEHLLATINLLTRTVRTFLAAEGNGTTDVPAAFPSQFPSPDFLDTLGVVFVWSRLRARLQGVWGLDRRLQALVDEGLSFDVLFNRVMHAIYYAGPRIPQQALHMLTLTDVYTGGANQVGQSPEQLSHHAEIDIDAAAIATVPRAFLQRLDIPPRDFIASFLDDQPTLITAYDTFLGRIGLVVAPIEDDRIYVDPDATRAAVDSACALAAKLGAGTIALTGLIPSATEYGQALAVPGDARLTTGHATTIASCVLMVERIAVEAGRRLHDEDVACVGLGSIGTGIVELMIAELPHPRSLMLVDVPAKAAELEALAARLRAAGFEGAIEVCALSGATLPEGVYDRRFIVSATSVGGILDVDRLRPGTLVVDDSAPHCFDPRAARRRFQTRRDLLFTEAGAVSSGRTIDEIHELGFSTGWDRHIREALSILHPEAEVIMGCVFSSVLTDRFDELHHTVGTVGVDESRSHLARLRALDFQGAPLYCRDFRLDADLIALFRQRWGRAAEAG